MGDALRDEVIAAQQARVDLLKWKLLVVAGLGAAALGLENESGGHVMLLCFIPFVCAYVDLLSYHVHIRNVVIGTFQKSFKGPLSQDSMIEYERFVSKISHVPREVCRLCMKEKRELFRLADEGKTDDLKRKTVEDWNRLFNRNCIFQPKRCPIFRPLRFKAGRDLQKQLCHFMHHGAGKTFAQENKLHLAAASPQEVREGIRHSDSESVFKFENWAVQWSTYVLCLALLVFVVLNITWNSSYQWPLDYPLSKPHAFVLAVSACFGALMSFLVTWKFRELFDFIMYVAEHMDNDPRVLRKALPATAGIKPLITPATSRFPQSQPKTVLNSGPPTSPKISN